MKYLNLSTEPSDIRFISQTNEVKKLLEAFEMEDMDEIEYWSDALKESLIAFSNNRKVFSEILFSDSDGKSLIRVLYRKEKAISVKKLPELSEGFSEALSTGKPVFRWIKTPLPPITF